PTLHFDGGLIGRALENPRALAAVGPKRTLPHVLLDVPVAPVGREIETAVHPGACAVRARKSLIIILGVERPCQGQLPMVVQATDAMRLGFGLAQGRQQHAGEDRNDGDHNQQFDQGEGAGATAPSAGLPQAVHKSRAGPIGIEPSGSLHPCPGFCSPQRTTLEIRAIPSSYFSVGRCFTPSLSGFSTSNWSVVRESVCSLRISMSRSS